MALRTQESLQRMFQQTKERQLRKKQHQSKLKLEARKEKYKEIDKRAKEALQSDKNKRMDYLSTLAPKRSENVRKQPHIKFSIYHSNLVERETSEDDLYLTREELMDAEDRGEGAIRWDVFDRLTEEFKRKY